MSSLKISYHYISSLTVSSTNRHPVHAGCLLSRNFFLEILALQDMTDLLSLNNGMELPIYTAYNPRRQQVSKHVQFHCVVPSGECQMVEYKCVLWNYLRNHGHMSFQVNGLVLFSPLSISVVGSRVPSSLNTTKHETSSFWYHKNKINTEINQLAVTAKILSQPGIQLCATTVVVQPWNTDFHGLQ